MPLFRWFWSLRLRWRIPLGAVVLLLLVASLYLLVSWLHYRQCRHLDLLSLVPSRLPVVVRCRDGAAHADRIRQTDLARALEAQVRRRGPFVEWVETASGRTWEELTAPLVSGPSAALLTGARLRGLLGADAILALEPAPARAGAVAGPAPLPRALFLTRIGFAEYLAWPVARRLARRSTEGAEADRAVGGDFRLRPGEDERGSGGQAVADPRPSPAACPAEAPEARRRERAPTRVGGHSVADVRASMTCERYRGVDLWRIPLPAGRFPPDAALGVAVKGDLLLVATDPELLPDALDRTFRDWAPSDDLPPWALPEGVPLAAGADVHRIPPGSGWLDALQRVPVREALHPLDPASLGRVTLAVDVRADGLHLEAAASLRPGATPAAPLPAPEAGARTALSGVPDDAIAVVVQEAPFGGFWSFFESVTLDPARETVAPESLGGPWSFARAQARDVELPALRGNGLVTHLLPRLRGGMAVALTRESIPAGAPAGAGAPPPQTVLALIGTAGGGDAAEMALRDLLQRRVAPLLARNPRDIVLTDYPVEGETVRLLQRTTWPVQVAYGEARGVLAVGVRPEAVVRSHEALLGRRKGIETSPRFQSVLRALQGARVGGDSVADSRSIARGAGSHTGVGGDFRLRPGEDERGSGGQAVADPPASAPVSLLYIDLRRLGAMLREVAPDLARFAKDRIDGPRLRQSLKGRAPRQPQETTEAWEQRITGLFEAEVKRTVDEAQRRIEAPALLLDPFSAAGLSVLPAKDGYVLRAALLQP
jgi:hypothetical protein